MCGPGVRTERFAANPALAAEHQTDHTEQTIEAGATHLRQLRPATGGNSHWDAKLGVYVLDNQTNTFYRQRTYYRWDNGWSRSISPNGPWEETDIHGVPGGLGRQFGQ